MTYRLWRRQCSNLGAPGKGVAAKPRGSRPPGPRGLTSLQAPLERFLSPGPFDVYFLPCSCLGLTVGMSLDPEVGVGTKLSLTWSTEGSQRFLAAGLEAGPGSARRTLCWCRAGAAQRARRGPSVLRHNQADLAVNKGGGDRGSQRGSVSASRGSGFSTSLLQAGCIWGG